MSVPIPTTRPLWIDASRPPVEDCLADQSPVANVLPVTSTTADSAPAFVPDAELLRDFIATRLGTAAAQKALGQIVERHGSMVYQVAHRTVSDRTLADDVFQATFLVLAQSARKIQRSASLAAWLHGTARNIGRKAIARKHATRSGIGTGVEMVTSIEDDPFQELVRSHERQLLDDELLQLPEIYRAPLVLHYLEERSHLEISQLLGITVSAVESRLKRARQELRVRLVRRGITLSVAIAAVGWGASVASAAPPAALVSSTISLAATGAAVGTSLTAGTSTAIQLAGKELAAMSAASKVTALVVGVTGTLTVGGAILLGAMVDGTSGAGQRAGSGDLVTVVATEEPGASDAAGFEPEPMLLVQNDGDKVPGAEEKADTAEPLDDDDQPAAAGEKEDAPGQPEESDDAASEMTEKEDAVGEPEEKQAPESDEKDDDAPMKEEDKEEPNDDPGPAAEEKEDASAESDEAQAPEVEEKDNDTPAMTKEQEDQAPDEMSSAEDESAEEGSEHLTRKGPLVASFRQLSPQDVKVYETLESETSLEILDYTLEEVSDYLQENHQLRVRFDKQALEDAGIATDLRTNIRVSGLSLHDSLSLMLEDVGGVELDYYVDRGGINITTSERMRNKDDLRFYDLSGDDEGGVIENFELAVESYARSIDEGLMNHVNNSSVTSFGDSLAIRATLDTHKKIEEFITGAIQLAEKRSGSGRPLHVLPLPPKSTLSVLTSAMRSTPAETNSKSEEVPDRSTLKIAKFRDLSAMDRKAYQALEQSFELDCPDITLAEFAEYLSATTSIPVRIDEVALDQEAKKASQIKVSYAGRNTLGNSLQIIFETAVTGASLDYYVDRGVLFITSHVGIESGRERYYDLSGGDEELSLGQRVQVYLKSADPEGMTTMSATGGDRFAITTSLLIHKKLETFLSEARE